MNEETIEVSLSDFRAMRKLVEAVAQIGIDFGYGVFELNESHINLARWLCERHTD